MPMLLTTVWLLLVVVIAWTAPRWARRRVTHRAVLAFVALMILGAGTVMLRSAADDVSVAQEDAQRQARLELGAAVDSFPKKWCAEPPRTSNDKPASAIEGELSERLTAAGAHPRIRWPVVYDASSTWQVTCETSARLARSAAGPTTDSGTPTRLSAADDNETSTSSAEAAESATAAVPGTAVAGLWDAVTAFEAVSAFSSDEVVRQAAANWDAGIDFDPVGLENGGWPVWIVAAAVLMWAARRIWVCHVLHGNAPIVVEVLEPNTSPAIPARDALVAAVGEIGLVRPSAAPGVAGDETVKTLDAVSAVVPTARPFITVVQEVFRAVRRQARYSVTLVHNPSGNTGTGSEGPLALVVQINAQPIGSPVLFRSVTGQDATSVGRSAAFDVGCAVLNRSRDVPAWAAWPPGTGEALDLYVLAMREARLPGSASDLRARTMEREKRRTLLRQAHRHAPGNGLIRHELARLEFQLGNSVVAAILLAQNAAVYPDFTESRYRYAVTLLMMSGDPATMWFEAPRGSRATCCDLVDPGLRSEQPDVFRHLTARRPHPVATRLCRDWLLEHSQFLLRDGRKFGWLAAVRAWVLEGREWSVSRQLHRTAQTAANGTEVIKKILALVDAGQQRTASESLFDALRGELQASKRDSWQVLYNKACCAARVYGIAAAEGWPRNDGWAKIAVDLLRDAITHPTFALARWSENASELVVHLDPDLEPLRSHPYFSSLTGMLTLSGAEERPKEA